MTSTVSEEMAALSPSVQTNQVDEIRTEIQKLYNHINHVENISVSFKAQLPALKTEREEFTHRIFILERR